ncbi:MAG: lysis system i-spanin subunit Rz [Pseudomonas sp.]|uniref:lysis system i-spanin subunit Rz n=1 Tax=Pseudomonas TaxID=286 RepID=UPI0003C0946D|nr:lysis system i-spanin subunit Rz [Pseudomonas sp. VLB120]AGZ37578.1 prophage PSPPH06, lysis protein [Pseudomonas sp. VLB120]
MTFSPIRVVLFLLLTWFAFDKVVDQRNAARSERDSAQVEVKGLREAARITGKRLAMATANDIKHTQELANALKRNQDLRDSVGNGDQRLFVPATCAASAVNVRAGTGTAGVAHAASAELAADARPDYFTLRDQLALSRQMILGLQDHVRSFCTIQPTTTGATQ